MVHNQFPLSVVSFSRKFCFPVTALKYLKCYILAVKFIPVFVETGIMSLVLNSLISQFLMLRVAGVCTNFFLTVLENYAS